MRHTQSNPYEAARSDALHVDLAEDTGLGYWTQQLNCSADELLAAMESVGRNAAEVAQFLEAAR